MLTLWTPQPSASASCPPTRCTSRGLNKLSGDRNAVKVFMFFFRRLQMRDRWEFLVLIQPPKRSPNPPNKSWKHPKWAGSIPAAGWTRPRCKPTLALLSSRVRLQLAAHYSSRPERERHTPDCLLAPHSIPNFLYRHSTDVFDRLAWWFISPNILKPKSVRSSNGHISREKSQNLLNAPTLPF